jgi:hypothetical protein
MDDALLDWALDSLVDLAAHDVSHELRDAKGRWTETPLQREIRYMVGQVEGMVRADHGPDRRLMPQTTGVPISGSKADKAFPNRAPGSEVDLTEQFAAELRSQGIEVKNVEVPVESLKPTQDQLVAPKVEGLARYMETAPATDRVYERIFTTKDDYVIDGHHRWAANTVLARLDGEERTMAVRQIGLSRDEALARANRFMDEWGLPRAGMTKTGPVVSTFDRKVG